MDDLTALVVEWLSGDPDAETRAELQRILDRGDLEALGARFSGPLTFGTAGIRGEVGAGPSRMNRAVVIRTTSGLATHLSRVGVPSSPVVVGFDARPTSRQFAEDTCGVLAAAGIRVLYFPDYTPTPLVAFAAKHVGAAAAVVVTASHNPPQDNGYKVYSSNAAQIIPPEDGEIARAIAAAPPAIAVPRVEDAFTSSHDLIATVPDAVYEAYWEEVDAARPDPTVSDLVIVYTPIHGVGGKVVEDVFRRAGHTGLVAVPSQAHPNGRFPTVGFPNPEEEGSLDLAVELAAETGADLIVANDPDADRLATAVPLAGEWRRLSGNETGVLLGDYVLRNHASSETPIVVNSLVSSPMLAELARIRGARHEVTLTGFKWIVNAGLALEQAGEGRFVYGYEEALGYTVGSTVRDKDGISAALIFADLVAGLRAKGESVLDRLADLWGMAGLWVSAQHSVLRPGSQGLDSIQSAVATLATGPPSRIGDYPVTEVVDYRLGAERRPVWLGAQALVELKLGDRGRALVRPSGTEPKLKIYVDLRGEAGIDPHFEQARMMAEATSVASVLAETLPL